MKTITLTANETLDWNREGRSTRKLHIAEIQRHADATGETHEICDCDGYVLHVVHPRGAQ